MKRSCLLTTALLVLGAHAQLPAQGSPRACGVERWRVKIAMDADADRINTAPVRTTVSQLAELPDDAVLKVPVDEHEVPTLEAALAVAVEHGLLLGAVARAYVEREHALPKVAEAYVRALEAAAGGDAVDDAVLWRIAEAAAEVGLEDPARVVRAASDAGIIQ